MDIPTDRSSLTIAGMLRNNAVGMDREIAVVSGNEALCWRELYVRSCRVANALAASGVGTQDRVAFLGRNGLPIVEYLFGCALINAVPVPINWRLTPSEIDATVTDAAAKLLIVEEEFAAAVTKTVVGKNLKVIVVGTFGAWPSYAIWRDMASERDPREEASNEDISLQLYTSGTTGRPKAILLAHGNVSYILDEISIAWRFNAEEISLVCMPLFHSGGLAWLLAGMAAGARQIICAEFNADRILTLLEEQRVTRAMFIPAMLSALHEANNKSNRKYSLKQINYTGSPITERVLLNAIETLLRTGEARGAGAGARQGRDRAGTGARRFARGLQGRCRQPDRGAGCRCPPARHARCPRAGEKGGGPCRDRLVPGAWRRMGCAARWRACRDSGRRTHAGPTTA